MGESKPPRKSTRKKRIVLFLVGVTLGIICRSLPPEYQGPCNIVVRVVGYLLGVAT